MSRSVHGVQVLAFGTYDKAAHPRVQVLLDGLRAHGHEVRECNVGLGLSTADRVDTLRRPWRLPGFVIRLITRWAQLIVAARGLPRPDVVLVGYLGHFDVILARRLFRDVPIALDHLVSGAETASDRHLGGRVASGVLQWLDRRAVAAADVVIVDTEEHRELVPVDREADTVVTPIGSTAAWFEAGRAARELREVTATTPADGTAEPLRVLFFGLFTPLQGAPVIGEAVRRLAGEPITFTMVGHGQDLDATMSAAQGNDKVAWHRWVSPDALPALVASHDVCLGIFGTGPKASRVVPTKVFQGLAAGCVVVTSNTPPQRRLLGDAALFVEPGDAAGLAEVLRRLTTDQATLRELRRRGAELASSRLTAEAVTAALSELMASRLPIPHR